MTLRRDGEGVAPGITAAVFVAILALIATSMLLPWTATAQEPTTPPDTTTSTVLPGGTAGATTSAASAQARTSSPATASSTSAVPTSAAGPVAAGVAAPAAGPAKVRPFALNPGIGVQITGIKKDGAPDATTPLKVGDSVEINGTWDASEAEPVPGDEFSVGLPPELRVPDGQPITLNGEGGAIWGTCVTGGNTLTCVLSDEVTDKPEQVKGTFTIFSKAVAYTASEAVPFTLNGEVVPVPLPGGGGISDGADVTGTSKVGTLRADKASVKWTIIIPGSTLAGLADEADLVTLPDTLSDNMTLCEAPYPAPTLQVGRTTYAEANGTVEFTQAGGAGSPATVVIDHDGPFRSDQNYKIEYVTCTLDGKPALASDGVTYENSVSVGGTEVSAEGVGADWTGPTTAPSKSGGWASGSRHTRMNWSVFIPGRSIAAADHTIPLEDFVGDGHEICAADLTVKVWSQSYLPGAGGTFPARVDESAKFDGLTARVAADRMSFTLTASVKDPRTFDPERNYYVEYATCRTSEGLPDRSNTFENTVKVGSATDTATVTGPTYTEKKTGALVQTPREINGVAQPAGTTLDWTVTIPGHHLENVTEPAEITDTFTASLAVCDAGGDLKKNIAFSVVARDAIGSGPGARPNRTLTDSTDVALDGNSLKITLPREDGDYTRDYNYVIKYSLCTSSGGLDARNTVYGNVVNYHGREAKSEVRQTWGGGGTGQGVTRGSFSLTKSLHRDSEPVPEDTTFTVRVQEFAPGVDPARGPAEAAYNVRVRADGTPVTGFNARPAGWTFKLTEPTFPSVPGVYFTPGKFTGGDHVVVNAERTEALVTTRPGSNVSVGLVNQASLGGARVTKLVDDRTGGELTGDESFVITADIDPDGDGPRGSETRTFTLKDGQYFDLTELPVGARVSFSERLPENTDRITWATPVFSPRQLTVGADAAANAVTVTNTARTTEGGFTLRKAVTGSEASNPAVPGQFTVNATWTDQSGAEQTVPLTLPADGTPVAFPRKLPGGTQVTLTEQVPANGNGLAWGVPAFSGDVTAGAAGTGVVTVGRGDREVTVTNVVTANDGTLRLTKQVSGEAADGVDDEEFTVEARWRDGTEYKTTQLTVRQGETTPLGVDLPVGTEVTFTEVALPEIAGMEWGTPSWGTDPTGGSWLVTNPGGTATGIVSDDPGDGRLITLTNEALWTPGSLEFSKYLFNGADPVPAGEWELPAGTAFDVRILGIDPALPAGTDFPAVGDTVTLDAGNGWSWTSGDVLPRGTVITFEELDPGFVPGHAWARPFYYVAADAGEAEDRDTVQIAADERAVVQIRNRPIPTTDVAIDKIVTGSKGEEITGDRSASFEVTATWSDPDDEARSCVLDVAPGGALTAAADCDAMVVGNLVQLPLDTAITLTETGARTAVGNVSWGDITWSVTDGSAEIAEVEGEPGSVVVTLTGDAGDAVALQLENEADLTEGGFTISKKLQGPEAYNDAVPATFDVVASWTDTSGAPRTETLAVPADGTPVEFPYALPGHTEVTLTEAVPENGNGLRWGTPAYSGDVATAEDGSAVVTIDREQIDVEVRNYVETNDGTLRLTKQISGEAAEAVGDEEFTVEARWRDGADYRTEQLIVRQGESTPLGVDLPYGTEVTFTEVGTPEIAGVDWGGIDWDTDPAGDSWLVTHKDGTATGIVSDDPTDGRLVTLTNEALWSDGSVGFTKYVLDGADPVPAAEAGLPEDAVFEVRIDGIEPALPAGVDFPAVGGTITLDSGNGWSWESGDVLPRNTVITFSEVGPAPLDGIDWARPSYFVAVDAGEPGDRNAATIAPGAHAEVQIRNRPIPVAPVDIDKSVTGPKGNQVARHESSTFQVTATWTDLDAVERSCVLDVTPGGGATPTAECDAVVIDGRAQFPLNTEISFVETGAFTEVPNVNWGEVTWGVASGSADVSTAGGEPAGATVVLTGDAGDTVTLDLVNATSSRGLILLPLPIPLPPFDGSIPTGSIPTGPGSTGSIPTGPGSTGSIPTGPGSTGPESPRDPVLPGGPATGGDTGGDPVLPEQPSVAGTPGHAGAPGQPSPTKVGAAGPSKNGESALAVTGADVAWLGGAALALIAGGAWLVLRGRREETATE